MRSVFIMVKPVFVELDGQTKELRYDFNAMMKYEQMVGTGFQQSFSNLGDTTLMATSTDGLSHKEKGITPQRVAKMLQKELQNVKTQDELYEPAIEAFYQGGHLSEEMYKAFREAMDDEYESDYEEDDDSDDEDDEIKNA